MNKLIELKDAIKKEILFQTEDGVGIFNISDEYYMVDNWSILPQTFDLRKNYKHFSTKKAAEEYILMNKPCLSFNDIMNISLPYASKKWLEDNGYTQNRANTFKFKKDKLKQLVKSKI